MSVVRRRQHPPQYGDYRRYKPYLRIDFRYRCCYCSIHESNWGSQRHFAVEHFRPKSKFPGLETQYSNLYYACDVCNGYKGEKWPNAADEALGYRFFDACNDLSTLHLRDNSFGELKPLSPCGAYSIASIRLNRATLITMRKQRRQLAKKFRELLRLKRSFEAELSRAHPSTAVVIRLLIKAYQEQLASVRTKYFRPPISDGN